MIAKYLWQAGSAIIAILATVHLYYTFFSQKFSSVNDKLVDEMKSSSANISKNLNVWKAWKGFNGSHSAGGIFIGVINFYMAQRYFPLLQSDHFLFLFNIITIVFYVWLAKKYWFSLPLKWLLAVLLCYLGSYIITALDPAGYMN